MNGKQAKRCRKLVYGDRSTKERQYKELLRGVLPISDNAWLKVTQRLDIGCRGVYLVMKREYRDSRRERRFI